MKNSILSKIFRHRSKLPEPYRSITPLPFDGDGWFYNKHQLLKLFKSNDIKNVIEVGSWLGLSTRFFAEQLPRKGKVYAVDNWLGSSEHVGDKKLEKLFHQFLSNAIHTNLAKKIIPIRMNSVEAAKAINIKADLIYIDASHEANHVYEDIIHWHPHLETNGIMCGDDWSYSASVRAGVKQAAFHLRQVLITASDFWWFDPS